MLAVVKMTISIIMKFALVTNYRRQTSTSHSFVPPYTLWPCESQAQIIFPPHGVSAFRNDLIESESHLKRRLPVFVLGTVYIQRFNSSVVFSKIKFRMKFIPRSDRISLATSLLFLLLLLLQPLLFYLWDFIRAILNTILY